MPGSTLHPGIYDQYPKTNEMKKCHIFLSFDLYNGIGLFNQGMQLLSSFLACYSNKGSRIPYLVQLQLGNSRLFNEHLIKLNFSKRRFLIRVQDVEKRNHFDRSSVRAIERSIYHKMIL